MKKILTIIIALTLVLIMSGCGYNDQWDSGNGVIVQHDELEPYLEENYYTQEEVDLIVDNILKDNYGNYSIDDNDDFWLIRIIARERDEENNIWIYEVEEVGDEDYTVFIESKDLFSIDELALGVETKEEIYIIDFNNGNVIIPLDTLENWQVNYTYATSQVIIGLNDRITELEGE